MNRLHPYELVFSTEELEQKLASIGCRIVSCAASTEFGGFTASEL